MTDKTDNLGEADGTGSMMSRARPEIQAMKGYSSARSLTEAGPGTVFLDANECPYEPFIGARNLSRYPMQQPPELVRLACEWLDVASRNLSVMRGADEAIDSLMRAFCVPAVDNIIICPPTFAMYSQSAMLQGVEIREAPLGEKFDLDLVAINNAADENTKLVFVCSPNNPTANLMDKDAIDSLCRSFAGKALVVVDETYIDYCDRPSMTAALEAHANLVVLRTLSKSHAAAGLRCGFAVARQDVTSLLQKVLAPYPIPQPVVDAALRIMAPDNQKKLADKRQEIVERRNRFADAALACDEVEEVLPSDANYVLVRVRDAEALFARARASGYILRNQSHQPGLANCLRVSIGTAEEMDGLLTILAGGELVPGKADRIATEIRKTNETAISVTVNLDRKSPVHINTGVGFYDHMLDQIAKHAGISLQLECDGDLHIDPHHTIEDCAIALGVALRRALGDKLGIGRYGFCLPMDESLVTVALDLSGRYYLDFRGDFPADHVGDLPTDMIEHIFRSLAENLQANLHIAVEGENAHHMVEACFKGFARALRQAVKQEGADLPSTKGML